MSSAHPCGAILASATERGLLLLPERHTELVLHVHWAEVLLLLAVAAALGVWWLVRRRR